MLALLALLIGEGLLLGVLFDSQALERLPNGWWSPLVDASGWLMPAGASMLAALLLVLAWSMHRESAAPSPSWRRVTPIALVHAVCALSSFALGARLFDGALQLERPGAWVGAWLSTVALSLVTWAAMLMPVRELARFVRARAGLIAFAILLGASAFAVGRLSQELWLPLRSVTFVAAHSLLRAVAPSVVAEPSTLTLGVGEFTVEIAPECSGYEGIGLTCVFVLASLRLFRSQFRFPRALWLLPIGVLASWAANVVRLVVLVLVGAYVSPAIGAGGFHSYAGTILFCTTALGTVAWALRSPWFVLASEAEREQPAAYPAAPYLVPFLALVVAALVSRAFSAGVHEPLFVLRPLSGAVALAVLWRARRGDLSSASTFAICAGALIAALWLALNWITPPPRTIAALAPELGVLEWSARLANTLVIVPIVEELAFRGFLARRVTALDFESVLPQRITWAGILISSLAFGALHRRPLAAFVAGVGYAWLYRRRGSLADAMVAHAITNLALVCAAFALDEHELWM